MKEEHFDMAVILVIGSVVTLATILSWVIHPLLGVVVTFITGIPVAAFVAWVLCLVFLWVVSGPAEQDAGGGR